MAEKLRNHEFEGGVIFRVGLDFSIEIPKRIVSEFTDQEILSILMLPSLRYEGVVLIPAVDLLWLECVQVFLKEKMNMINGKIKRPTRIGISLNLLEPGEELVASCIHNNCLDTNMILLDPTDPERKKFHRNSWKECSKSSHSSKKVAKMRR